MVEQQDTVNKSLGRIITPLARLMMQEIAEVLVPFRLTPGEQPFYIALADRDGITQEELTAIVRVDKSATTRALKSLEAKGLVYREQNKNDRRSNLIYLSEDGKAMHEDVVAALLQFNEQFVRLLSPEEYETVFCALNKMDTLLQQQRKARKEES